MSKPNKDQAIYNFWSSFGLPAYDQNSVPTGKNRPAYPYITYDTYTGALDDDLILTGQLWYRSDSWETISLKKQEIENAVYSMKPISIEGGYLWLSLGSPFAQRMGDDVDDAVKRYILNISAEFLTAH